MWSLLSLLACGTDLPPPPPPGGGITAQTDSGTAQTDSGTPTDATLTGPCEAPDSLPADPITLWGGVEDAQSGSFYELADLEVLADRGLVLAVGQGGLIVFDVSGDAPTLSDQFPWDAQDRFLKLEPLSGDRVAVTNWNDNFRARLAVFDVSDPTLVVERGSSDLTKPVGMGWVDPYLAVLGLDGTLTVVDLTDSDDLVTVATATGLATPYELEVVDSWGYVADTQLGLVTVDLSDPTAPMIVGAHDGAVGAWDLAADETTIHVALGGGGVAIFDREDPAAPALVSVIDDIGSIGGVSVAGDLLAAVSHQDLVLIDVSDPSAPSPLGKQRNQHFGLAVELTDERVYVADWGYMSVWDHDRSIVSPEADIESSTLYFYDGDGTRALEVTNLGADTLTLTGAEVSDPRLAFHADELALAPGESTDVVLSFVDDGSETPLDAELCLATNDPDEPVVTVPVVATSDEGVSVLAVGQPAPDFTLEDLDGNVHRLSDQLGHPVVLVWFATW